MSNITTTNPKFYATIEKQFTQIADKKTFLKETNFAIQIIKESPALQKCSAESVLKSVFEISQTGLTLNPVLNYASLIPRKGKCSLMPQYQGLIKLATDTDNIKSIDVQLVYEGDECEVDLSTDKKITKHIPYQVTGKAKGKILYGYSVATLQDGLKHVEIMSISDIYEVREYSQSYQYEKDKHYKNSPWFKSEPEMCRKTIVRRHFKYLPKSNNVQLERAIELDNQDYNFPMTYEQGNYIESLLMTSAIGEKEERQIYQALHGNDMSQERAKECIEYLKENQRDPIQSGDNYQMGDIQNSLTGLKES